MSRPFVPRFVFAVAAFCALLSVAGCGGGRSGSDVAGSSRNESAVVAVAPLGEAASGMQDVRLSVTGLESVRGPVAIYFRGASDVACTNPRITRGAAPDAVTADVVCTLPEGRLPADGGAAACRPADFRICGDNGCGPGVEEKWYFTSGPGGHP